MIFANIINDKKNSLTEEFSMNEFYNNEISLLESAIEYQNQLLKLTEWGGGSLNESANEVNILHENFVTNIIEKAKELIRKFIEWIKRCFQSIKNFFTKDTKSSIEDKKESVDKAKKKISDSKSDNKEKIKAISTLGNVSKSEDSNKIKFSYVDSKEFIKETKNTLKQFENLLNSNEMQNIGKKLGNLEGMMTLTEDQKSAFKEMLSLLRDHLSKIPKSINIDKFRKEEKFNTMEELQRFAMKIAPDHAYAIKECQNAVNNTKAELNEELAGIKQVEREFLKEKDKVDADSAALYYSAMNIAITIVVAYANLAINSATKYLNTIKVYK